MSDLPTILYRCPGPHAGEGGKTYDTRPAKTEDELLAALTEGWCRSLPEACGFKVHEAPKPAPRPLPVADAEPLRGPFTAPPKAAPPKPAKAKPVAAGEG